jgi:hypothetical protein
VVEALVILLANALGGGLWLALAVWLERRDERVGR